jgi:hypothetical protein
LFEGFLLAGSSSESGAVEPSSIGSESSLSELVFGAAVFHFLAAALAVLRWFWQCG